MSARHATWSAVTALLFSAVACGAASSPARMDGAADIRGAEIPGTSSDPGTATSGGSGSTGPSGSAGAVGSTGMQYDGSLRLLSTATQALEISAPILPRVDVLYEAEGPAYPASQQEREALADDATLLFPDLLVACQVAGYAIKPLSGSLTQSDLLANYEQVALCAYELYTAKPYWIPKLLLDVDICTRRLGGEWRMIQEADLAAITADQYQQIAALLPAPSDPMRAAWYEYYFTQLAFVITSAGGIARVDLSPTATARISPLRTGGCSPTAEALGYCTPTTPIGSDLTRHLEPDAPGLTLRCIRGPSSVEQRT